jgi:hypothetical protein
VLWRKGRAREGLEAEENQTVAATNKQGGGDRASRRYLKARLKKARTTIRSMLPSEEV